ncbi:MAG: MFS transporter [Candidatus Latescibacterota bacterium]|nr:MFS transporter [Candidatus Latescibacterota bacterium]
MLTDYLANLRLIGRDAQLLIAAQTIMAFGYVGMYSVLFNLYLLRLGYDPAAIGEINAIGRMGFALVGIPAGLLGVRFGSRPLLIVGEIIIVIGLAGAPLGEFLPLPIQRNWLSFFYFLGFAGASLYFVNSTPYLMSVSGTKERSHVFSVIGVLTPLFAVAGSFTGGLLPGVTAEYLGITDAHPASYRYPLILAGVLFVFTLPLVLATHYGRSRGDEPAVNPLCGMRQAPWGPIVSMSVVMFLTSVAVGVTLSFFNVYLDDGLGVATALIGTVTAATQLVAAPASALMPIIVARLGYAHGFTWTRLVMGIGLIPMALIPTLSAAAVSMLLIASASAISQQTFTIFSQSVVSERWRTLMSGVLNTTMGAAWAMTALVGGHIIERWGYGAVFLSGSVVTGLALIAFIAIAYHLQEHDPQHNEHLATNSTR